ncbi:unnamed protein product [Acanthoscelides obtectus]|nr:unnamed protein product [Acanthoscelides obtectus]CAK1649955.1 hypothetical protein AOBTE_LOCUS16513 [Acanthoscelides obtectus]
MTIYDVPKIVAVALPSAITPKNITAGFKVSGVYPFNECVFSEDEFLPSYATDRPLIEQAKDDEIDRKPNNSPKPKISQDTSPQPGTSRDYSEILNADSSMPKTSEINPPLEEKTPEKQIIKNINILAKEDTE